MNLKQFYHWCEEIQKHITGLKKWQRIGLMLIVYGIIKARRSMASLLAEELAEFGKASTVERRIQRWIANPRIDVKRVCQEWTKWILENYRDKDIFLLVDETKIGKRIGCLMISLAVAQRAIPLVWRCYRGNSAKDYPEEGQVGMIREMLKQIMKVKPEGKRIILEADRGIGNSSFLMKEVKDLGAYYLFRIKISSILTNHNFKGPLCKLAQRGQVWHGKGRLYTKSHRMISHIHIIWELEEAEPWCLATNLPDLKGKEYALRVWQEESFRDLKSGGWQWQNSLLRNPQTVERFLIPMTIAYAWCVSLGLLLPSLDRKEQYQIDYRRSHKKYCVFRLGLRFFKRFLISQKLRIPLQMGPFYAPP
jgi:hypothetical protein